MNEARVCVHVPSYNQREFLPETIESVLAQTFQDLHIIIVDDASTDGSAEVISDYVRRHPEKIRAVFNEKNLGIPRRLGVALKHCQSEFFCYLDGDDLWEKDALESMVEVMEKRPEVGLVYGDVERFDHRTGETIQLLSRIAPPAEGFIFDELIARKNFVAPQAHLARRRCIEETNVSLENTPFRISADRYLWLSICSKFPAAYIPRVLARYRWHDRNKSIGVKWDKELRQVVEHVMAQCPEMISRALDALERLWTNSLVGQFKGEVTGLKAERDRYKAERDRYKAEGDRYEACLEIIHNMPPVRPYRAVKRKAFYSEKNGGIAFVLPGGITPGGVTVWSFEMCRRLAARGKRTVLIQHTSSARDISIPGLQDVPVIRCEGVPASKARLKDLVDFVRPYLDATPSVFVPNWSKGSYATCAYLSLRHADALRVIGMVHGDQDSYYEWMRYYEPIIHMFIAVSDEIGSTLARMIPHRAKDIVVRPYAVDVPARLGRDYSSHGEPVRLVYAGRLDKRQKCVQDLVELLKALEGQRIDFRFRIIGEGEHRENLLQAVKALSQATRSRVSIESTLAPNGMSAVWNASDVFVLVSEYEGMSISMLEAMAHGCVPVVTKVSGTASVIRQGLNGFVVPVGRMEEMARLVQVLESDRRKLAELGRKAHDTLRDRFSYDEYTCWFCDMIKEVWRRRPRSWPWQRPVLPLTG